MQNIIDVTVIFPNVFVFNFYIAKKIDYENCVDLLKVVCSHIRDPKIANAIILAYY